MDATAPLAAPSTLAGMMEVALAVSTAPIGRWLYNRWGATAVERARILPGDELCPAPRLQSTRAITIEAPPSLVWPYLMQLGQGRGGLYSYDGLENLIGCDIHSADRPLPEQQQLAVGDHILFGPAEKGYPGQVVVAIEPRRALVMCALDPRTRTPIQSATWAFVLDEERGRKGPATRLLVRSRNGYPPSLANHLMWHLVEPVAFVMERRMLLGIKLRAERDAAAERA